jgi:hypothetical protein
LSLSLSTYRPPSFWQAHAAVAVEAAPLLAPAPALPLAPKERERETERAIEKESSRARGRVGSIETKEKKGIFFSTAAPLLRPPRKKRPVSPTSFSSLSLSLSLSLSHSTYNDGERLWSHGLRWAVSPKRKEAWSSVRASKKNDAAGNSFGGQKKALNQRSLFLPSRSLQNRCFPMWTDFSEVRSCLHVDFGERDKRERAFGSLSFSFRRPLFVGDGLFPCSQSSTPSLNLFSTSTFLSPPQKKLQKTVHPRYRRPAQVQGPPRRLPRVPPPPEGDREAQRRLQGAEEGGRGCCSSWRRQGRGGGSRQEALNEFFFDFFPPPL